MQTLFADTSAFWQVPEQETGPDEPEEASCTVCKEGYATSPRRLLCAYVYSKLELVAS